MGEFPPSTERGRRTRERLLLAAEAELLATGRLEVSAVARRAAASLGLLYRYFDGKDELVRTVVDRFYDRYDDAVFAVKSPGDQGWFAGERLRLQREVAFLFREPLARRIVAWALDEPAAAQADAARLRRHIDLAARNIVRGQRSGEVAPQVDVQLAAAGFIGALRAVVGKALIDPVAVEERAVVDTVWRMGAAVIVRSQSGRT